MKNTTQQTNERPEKMGQVSLNGIQPLLFLRGKGGTEGKGRYYPDSNKLVVYKGARVRKEPTESMPDFVGKKRKKLLDEGILKDDGEVFRLTQDRTFDSPSTAAGVLCGASKNGKDVWKDKHGRSINIIYWFVF